MGAFALKKKERKNLKNNPTNHNPNPSVPSPPTLWSFFAPFACLPFFHQHGLPRENKTPVALHARSAHRCPVTNQVAPTAAGGGGGAGKQRWNSQVHLGVEGQDGNWSWEKSARKGQESGGLTFPHS